MTFRSRYGLIWFIGDIRTERVFLKPEVEWSGWVRIFRNPRAEWNAVLEIPLSASPSRFGFMRRFVWPAAEYLEASQPVKEPGLPNQLPLLECEVLCGDFCETTV